MPREKQFDEDEVIRQLTGTFRKKGYGACSVGDLVDASGLSRSSLYDTFGDKEQLFLRCMQHYVSGTATHLAQISSRYQAPLERIGAVLRMPFDDAGKMECNGCLIVNTMSEAEVSGDIRQLAVESSRTIEQFLSGCVRDGQAQGTITRAATPQALGRYLFTVMSGLLVQQKAQPDKAGLHKTIALTLQMLQPSGASAQ